MHRVRNVCRLEPQNLGAYQVGRGGIWGGHEDITPSQATVEGGTLFIGIDPIYEHEHRGHLICKSGDHVVEVLFWISAVTFFSGFDIDHAL